MGHAGRTWPHPGADMMTSRSAWVGVCGAVVPLDHVGPLGQRRADSSVWLSCYEHVAVTSMAIVLELFWCLAFFCLLQGL